MKFLKHTLLTALAFFGICAAVLYSSCEQDSCMKLKCKNGGSCADNYCRCPTGYEGTECEIKISNKFAGTYYGNRACPGMPPLVDTAVLFLKSEPNVMGLVVSSRHPDTIYGTVSGNAFVVPDIHDNGYLKQVTGVLDNVKFTVNIREGVNGNNTDCYFIGFK